AYFGMAHPEQYGVKYRPLPGYLRFTTGAEVSAFNPYTPAPGWYAISATSLRLGTLEPQTAHFYDYFAAREPDARAGYSLYLYEVVDERDTRPWVVRDTAVGLLTPQELGISPETRTAAKWVTGASDIIPAGEPFTADDAPLNANFGDQLTLLGVGDLPEQTVAPGVLALTLYWQVGSQPINNAFPARDVPLRAFVHLTGEEVWQVLAQYDGWDTAVRGLEQGDIIVHPVQIWVGEQVAPGTYPLLVGLYQPATGERLRPTTTTDFVPLGTVQVVAP
ncbi:MAG: hypothetical protein KDD89_13795, partial [Anaerolineales bacterium]|nr:hypothetical protein [Anaerolineales bacterium]